MGGSNMPIIALFLLSILWGSTFYFTKLLLPDFHPVSIVFYRCLFGAMTLLPFYLTKKGKGKFTWDKVPFLLGIPLLSAGIPWILMSISLQNLDTTISAVLNATGPIFGVLITIFLLRERVKKPAVISVIVGFTGIFIAFAIGSAETKSFQIGSAIVLLLAVSFYALSSVLTGKFLTMYSVVTISLCSMTAGILFSGPIMLAVDANSLQGFTDSQNVYWFLLLGGVNSGVGNLLFYYIVKSGGAIFALSITYLMPITTILLGYFLLHEPVGAGTFIALVFVLYSVYLSKRKGVAD
ncbi:hypothetical protein CSV73_06920 [Sporosarcina sp. P1]|nr:hypothetical protein CSV73_06920 [Sporosarcina sp. P1]